MNKKNMLLLPSALGLCLFSNCKKQDQESKLTPVDSNTKSQREVVVVDDLDSKTIRQADDEILEVEEKNENPISKMIDRKEIQEMVKKKMGQRNKKELNRLQKLLDLTPAQIEAIQARLAKRHTGGDYDAFLSETLTADQLETLAESEIQEQKRMQEVAALRQLAEVQSVLNVSDEQKDAILNAFYENPVEQSSISESMISGAQRIEIKAGQEGRMDLDMESIMERSVGIQEQKNAELLGRLEPILDENQVNDYKQHLEEKTQAIKGAKSIFKGITIETNSSE